MNKTTLCKRHPYIQSLDPRRFSRHKPCHTISCSTQLPPILKETPNKDSPLKINESLSFEKRPSELPLSQFIPKRIPEAEDIILKVFKGKVRQDRAPREKTLIDIKKELIRIINEKKKEVSLLRNGEIRRKWEVEREVKRVKEDEERKEVEGELRFKEEERQRLMMVLKRRKVEENRFLGVGKKGVRESMGSGGWSSEEFLKGEIEDLKGRLRDECVNVMRQKDSYQSAMGMGWGMGRVGTPNPEEI